MPSYSIQFRGCPGRKEEDFRDLAQVKSEAMRRAADIAEIEATAGKNEWVARIYEGEVLQHEILRGDLADPAAHRPEHVPPEEKNDLDEGIADSFPASDPPAAVSTTVVGKEK